jgi:hypothetical protein
MVANVAASVRNDTAAVMVVLLAHLVIRLNYACP